MPCKTRQAALRGERSKPHFYLSDRYSRQFSVAATAWPWGAAGAIAAFEARIDWSTWGASR